MRLELNGIEVTCIIGDLAWERKREQPLSVDLSLELDDAVAASDSLDATVDYVALAEAVRAALRSARCRMIEHAAAVVRACVLGFPQVRSAEVRVTKRAPVPGLASATAVLRTAVLALLALAAGCSVIRNARRAQEAAEPAGRGEVVSRTRLDLRGYSLEGFVGFAMTNRPEMASARLAVEDARLAMKAIAAEAPLVSQTPWTSPHVSLKGGYSETSPGVTTSGGDWRTYGDPSAGLSLDLLVYDFGRNRAQARAQAERVIAAEQTLVKQGYVVFGEVAKGYFEFIRARSMLDVKITSRNDYAEQLTLVEARLEAGEAQMLDVLRAKVDLASAVQEVVAASNEFQTTGATFMLALGVDMSRGGLAEVLDPSPIPFGTVYRAFPETAYEAAAAYERARTNAPAMCVARAQLRAASRDVDYAIADLRPKVTASLSLNWLNPVWVWGWGVSAVQPIFEGFRRTTAIERATVALETAETTVEAASQKLSSDIQTAVSVRDNAVEGLLSAITSARSAKENMSMVTEQFAVGDASRIDQSAAVAQYWSAVGDCITAFYVGQRAEAALYALVGSAPVYHEEKLEKVELLK